MTIEYESMGVFVRLKRGQSGVWSARVSRGDSVMTARIGKVSEVVAERQADFLVAALAALGSDA